MTLDNNKKKILIVDDESQLALLYKSSLEAQGFVVSYCANAEEALQTARALKPDLIILDLMMPRLSGFDAIDLFRSTPETRRAQIIILSALSQPEDIEKAKKLGASDYIIKSDATLTDIIGRIKQLLGTA